MKKVSAFKISNSLFPLWVLCALFCIVTPAGAVPTVTSTDPADAVAGIYLTSAIKATFSGPMNAATINTSTFTVTGVTGTVTYDASSNTAIFTPSPSLSPAIPYTATITTGVKDASGNNMASNYVWSFTTIGFAKVIATDPLPDAKDVSLNAVIRATFDGPIDPPAVPFFSSFFYLRAVDGRLIRGAVTYDASTNTAAFAPSSLLPSGTVYSAGITSILSIGKGGFILGLPYTYAWQFATLGPPPLTVTATDPSDNTGKVPVNARIKAVFNKGIDPSTLGKFTLHLPWRQCTMEACFPCDCPCLGESVPGTVQHDASTNTAVFTPSANLAYSTTYTAMLVRGEEGLKDVSGNYMPQCDYLWDFTTAATAAPPDSGGGGGSSCFIATAAFGSYLHPFVKMLRSFRDTFLLTTAVGRSFVAWYYKVSPSVADAIRTSETVKAGVRTALLPVVGISYLCLTIGVVPTLLVLFLLPAVICIGIRHLYRQGPAGSDGSARASRVASLSCIINHKASYKHKNT